MLGDPWYLVLFIPPGMWFYLQLGVGGALGQGFIVLF